MKNFADNCGACGREYSSADLRPVKLAGFPNLKICAICSNLMTVIENYAEAAELISTAFNSAPDKP